MVIDYREDLNINTELVVLQINFTLSDIWDEKAMHTDLLDAAGYPPEHNVCIYRVIT
jgi:hypothetical protein